MRSKEDFIRILKSEINMIKSHQNESNWDLLEDMIAARILLIMELRGTEIKLEGCDFCETPCLNSWCCNEKDS